MQIKFTCQSCKAGLRVDVEEAGRQVECPACHEPLTVPRQGVGPGTIIGGFKIKELLGSGGMGEVYRARQLSMDRDVALKILPSVLTQEKGMAELFLNEVRMTARLEHPNIVTAYEAGMDSGVYYLAMAYVRGDSLAARLKRKGAMQEAAALTIARKIAMALAYAWNKHRLIHRDIKPPNIILDEDGEPKLLDMGLSKSLEGSPRATKISTVIGTPNYMSPEQGEGARDLDFRADMYSLGATLYHMLTGELPFAGSTVTETLRKQALESLPDPREFRPRISEACIGLLEAMLAKDRERRHASWEALIADVDAVLQGRAWSRAPLAAGGSVLVRLDAAKGAEWARKKIVVGHSTIEKLRGVVTPRLKAKPVAKEKAVWLAIVALALVAGLAIIAASRTKWRAPDRSLGGGKPRQPQPVAIQPIPISRAQKPASSPAELAKPAAPAARQVTPPTAAVENVTRPGGKDEVVAPTKPAPTESASPPPAGVEPPTPAVDEIALAADLLKGDFASARRRLREAKAALPPEQQGELTGLLEMIDEVAAMPEVLLDSFRKDIGREVTVLLKQGQDKLRIDDVKGTTVIAIRLIRRDAQVIGELGRNFSLDDLAPTETLRRLGRQKSAALDIMRGLAVWNPVEAWKAKMYFQESGSLLGQILISRIASATEDRKQSAAVASVGRAYGVLLSVAGISGQEEDLEKVALDLRKKKFAETQIAKIRQELEVFNTKHGETDFAGTHRQVLDVLAHLRPNTPLYVDRATLNDGLKRLQQANGGSLKWRIEVGDYGIVLDLSANDALRSISPLVGLPIISLSLGQTWVSDLSPLKNMPLAYLSLRDCKALTDLNPLKSLPLTSLDLSGCSLISDFRPLRDLRLKDLNLSDCGSFKDVGVLRGMSLASLRLRNCGGVKDLSPLKGMPITNLVIQATSVTDLAPLRGMPLQRLSLIGTPVRDLTPLKDIKTLKPENVSLR